MNDDMNAQDDRALADEWAAAWKKPVMPAG